MDLLDTAFPPTSNVSYAKAETSGEPGSKKLRLWMLGIHPDSGNSGMMVNDGAETLVQLICVYGFRAEADKMIGVEMFAGKTADQSFTTAINRSTPYEKKQLGSSPQCLAQRRRPCQTPTRASCNRVGESTTPCSLVGQSRAGWGHPKAADVRPRPASRMQETALG